MPRAPAPPEISIRGGSAVLIGHKIFPSQKVHCTPGPWAEHRWGLGTRLLPDMIDLIPDLYVGDYAKLGVEGKLDRCLYCVYYVIRGNKLIII